MLPFLQASLVWSPTSTPCRLIEVYRHPAERLGIRMEFHDRLKKAMDRKGLNQTQLAKLMDVKAQSVQQWENGVTMPRPKRFDHLAEVLGVSAQWLIFGEGEAVPEDKSDRTHVAGIEENAELVDMEVIEGDEPLSHEEVWLPVFREVEFSAGDGCPQVLENHGNQKRFSLTRLNRAGVKPENAALAVAKGDSMTPVISDGATLGIDKGCRHIIDGKVYVLDHSGMLRVKRLYRMPLNRVRVVSDNADEYPEEVYSLADPDAPKILGRVFWWENFD